jgi:hypothetical protein
VKKEQKKKTGTIQSIDFDKENRNCMIINFEDGTNHFTAIPPGKNRIDILTDYKLPSYYNYKFTGLVIITQENNRLIYLDGKLIHEQLF